MEPTRNLMLEQDIAQALAQYAPTIAWKDNACQISADKGSKRVEISWPYPLTEAYFDFSENGEQIFFDWVEFYEGEPAAEVRDYIVYISKRFLEHPARSRLMGKWLEITELQVQIDGQWVNVFD